jgi:sugar/nucleoside kinase (ribokinase family)
VSDDAAAPDLVLLGNLLVDDLVFADGTTRMGMAGGALLHASLGAALWGARVGCVSLYGDDYPTHVLDALRARGIALDGVIPLGRGGVRVWLLYEGDVRHVVYRLDGPSHESISPTPAQIPAAWRGARAFHLAPMPLARQRELVESCRGGFISVDPYALVTESSLDAWRAVLAGADVFLPSEDELRLDDVERDPHAALRRLAVGRLHFIAFKRGARGGILYDAHEDRFYDWAARAGAVVDPTGAGDAFGQGFVTALLRGTSPVEALDYGVITASFAIERWGADALLAATRDEADARLARWTHALGPA